MLQPCEDLPRTRGREEADPRTAGAICPSGQIQAGYLRPHRCAPRDDHRQGQWRPRDRPKDHSIGQDLLHQPARVQVGHSTVYTHIYKGRPCAAELVLTPMPRLEVETISDFKVLFDIGALAPDMSLEPSRIMVGRASSSSRNKERMGAQRNGDKQTGGPPGTLRSCHH